MPHASRTKRKPMANSMLEHRFAGKNASTQVCCCGKPTYPDSIWTPILKVTTNRGTAGCMTWEFHTECVRKALQEGYEGDESARGARIYVRTLSRARHCIVTGESLPKGTEVVWMEPFYGKRNKKAVVTTKERIEELLNSTPKPIECANENVIIDWALNHSDWDVDVIREKYLTKKNKVAFETAALKILDFLQVLEGIRSQIESSYPENPFVAVKALLQERAVFLGRNYCPSEFAISDYLYHVLVDGGSLEGRFVDEYKGQSQSLTISRRARRLVSTVVSHGFELLRKDFFKQMIQGTCLDQIGDVTLVNQSRKGDRLPLNESRECVTLLNFLCKYDKRREVDMDELAVHLVGDLTLVRQLCKHLQDRTGV